ncbi:hypothetical protein VB796_08800 [Arcicella sp. LKC2W]|uniref:histone H1 n=1 Tax=Arcicella sp. LKC2W TaxID=2984198 RepID=UPI002B201870|nr:histone H1 [Arcicella sp. LKC2W]MEA5459133.1 hypothetical protein [Arcicella sp. LKC2W]
MKAYDELKALVNSLEEDVIKFDEGGNAAAGTRVRVALQKVKKDAQALRTTIQNIKEDRINA